MTQLLNSRKIPAYFHPVHGTWGIDEQNSWTNPDSPFANFARGHNIIPFPKPPFRWDSEIDGTFSDLFEGPQKHSSWRGAGYSFAYYMEPVSYSDRNVIASSHALQIIAYAAALRGIELRTLITVGSPIRYDMTKAREILKGNVTKWVHIYDANWDRMATLGQLFDGTIHGSRSCPEADLNIPVPNIGHTEIFRIPEKIELWNTNGWFDLLR